MNWLKPGALVQSGAMAVMAAGCQRGFAHAASGTGPQMQYVDHGNGSGGMGPLGCKKDRTTPSAAHDGAESAAAYETETLPPRCSGTLRLVTYNVCFHPSDLDIRLKAIAQILESVDADVVALQEMTDRILDILALHISKEWHVFKQSPSHVEDLFVYETGYFTCLLVKKCVQVVDTFSLRFSITAMARSLQYAVLRLPTRLVIESDDGDQGKATHFKKVVVATSHLESAVASRSGQETREHQLQEGGWRGNDKVNMFADTKALPLSTLWSCFFLGECVAKAQAPMVA